jgi:hypothetical protein
MTTKSSDMQGEGNYDAARQYDEAASNFAKSGKVEPAAKDAAKAREGVEREALDRAEEEGKKHAKH